MDYILCAILVINGLRGRCSRSSQSCWCQTGVARAPGGGCRVLCRKIDCSITEVRAAIIRTLHSHAAAVLVYNFLCEIASHCIGQTTKRTSVFSRPAQSQHIPQMLASANKDRAHMVKRVVVLGGALTCRSSRGGCGS